MEKSDFDCAKQAFFWVWVSGTPKDVESVEIYIKSFLHSVMCNRYRMSTHGHGFLNSN